MPALLSSFIANIASRLGLVIDANLTKDDLKVLKQLGLKFRGSNAWPQFRSFQPGYYPWHLTESEAKYLTLCLEQARDVALCLEKDPDWLSAPNKNHYLVRVPVDETSVATEPTVFNASMGQQLLFKAFDEPHRWQWKTEWLKPAPLTRAKSGPIPLMKSACNASKIPVKRNTVLGRLTPSMRLTLLAVTTGLFSLTHSYVWTTSRDLFSTPSWLSHRCGKRNFAKLFLRALKPTKLVPSTLWVRKEELRELFEPVATRLGIEVRLSKKLPAIDRAKRELLKFLKSRA